MKSIYFLSTLLLFLACGTAAAQNEFGRMYTTPGQRNSLDELREKRPQEEIIINVEQDNILETAGPEVESTASIDSITVNGIVYRSDGKNTAWINRNTTNEGRIETQYTKVAEKDVRPDRVNITLPDNQTSIQLKVGQEYDMHTQRVYDLVEDGAPNNSVIRPEGGAQSR